MNRRNFLKLFGLLMATPAVANAASAVEPEPIFENDGDWADWMILQTPKGWRCSVEIDNQDVQCISSETAEDTARHHEWCQVNRIHANPSDNYLLDGQFLLVSEKSKVGVTSPDGITVWFSPRWCPVEERFKTVLIRLEVCHDIFLNDDGAQLLELKSSTLMATIDDEIITETTKEW